MATEAAPPAAPPPAPIVVAPVPPKPKRPASIPQFNGSEYIVKPKKCRKDPAAPKKPSSAFLFFASACRKTLEKLTFVEEGHEIGKQWKGLDDAAREPYLKLAETDKQRYATAMATYVPDPAYVTKKAKSIMPALMKDPNKPKRGRTAYFIYCDENRDQLRKEHPKKTMGALSKVLSEGWKNCPSEEREACEAQAVKEKQAYDEALKNYTPSDEYKAAMAYMEKARNKAKGKSSVPVADTKKKAKATELRKKIRELRNEVREMEKTIMLARKLEQKVATKKREISRKESQLITAMKPPTKKLKLGDKPPMAMLADGSPADPSALLPKKGKKPKKDTSELRRKKDLVGKWVAVDYDGEPFRGEVVKYSQAHDKHTVRWVDTVSDEDDEYETEALKVNEYTVLDPAAVNEILEALAKEKKGGKKTAKARK